MAQNDIEITTTPPLPGLTLVNNVNSALQSVATDFSGAVDPAGLDGVGPYVTWADTANGLLKRRNAADTAWVVEGQLFKEAAIVDDLVWRSKAIGEPFALLDNLAGVSAPDNSGAAKYIKLTAADPYNTGLLTSESVSGSAPLVVATAVISLADSPLNGLTVNLWNTERRIPRGGNSGVLEDDAMQAMTGSSGHAFAYDSTGTPGGVLGVINQGGMTLAPGGASFSRASIQFNNAGVVRTSTENRMKNQGVTYYMRIK